MNILYKWSLLLWTLCAQWGEIQARLLDNKFDFHTTAVDPNNRIWLGSSNGLYVYENRQLNGFAKTANLQISSLCFVGQTLLIGTQQGSIYLLPSGERIPQKLVQLGHPISDIEWKPNHPVVIATKGEGYYTIDPYQIKHWSTKNGLHDDFIYQVDFDSMNKIWSASDQGLQIQDKNSFQFLDSKDGIPDPIVTSFQIKDKSIYFITQSGHICKRSINRNDTSNSFATPPIQQSLNHILVLDKSLYISSDSGLLRYSHIGQEMGQSFRKQSLQKSIVDLEGNHLIAGKKILELLPGEQLQWITESKQQPIRNVHSILAMRDQLWLTPDQGLLNIHLKNGTEEFTRMNPAESMIDITDIQSKSLHELYIATSGAGCFIYNTQNKTFSKVPLNATQSGNTILALSADSNRLWMATLNGIWYRQNLTDTFRSLENQWNHKKIIANDLLLRKTNHTLFASDGTGLIALGQSGLYDFGIPLGISARDFYHLEEDSKGRIWTNARNQGIYCIDGQKIYHFTEEEGLSDNEIVSFTILSNQYVVCVSQKGIDLIHLNNHFITSYPAEEMSLDFEPEYQSISQSGHEVFIGTSQGVLCFGIPSYKKIIIPEVYISQLKVMNQNQAIKEQQFDDDQNYFSFSVSNRSNHQNHVFYRYRLLGLSDIWSVTSNHEIIFPRLEPGDYQLEISNSNNRNFHNAHVCQYSFSIKPPYWQSIWFIIFVFLCFASLIILYIRFREKNLNKIQLLEKEKAIAELEALKTQVSPHFLFNSFNTLLQVIEEDQEKALEYTSKLSDFYRSLISYRNKNLVSLEEEWQLLENYFFLQKMRFEDALHLHISGRSENDVQYWIPPLILQLLAENAIKHNTVSLSHPLHIEVSLKDHQIIFRNNINVKKDKEKGEGIGIENIRNRYKSLISRPVVIQNTGTHFTVMIPVIHRDELQNLQFSSS